MALPAVVVANLTWGLEGKPKLARFSLKIKQVVYLWHRAFCLQSQKFRRQCNSDAFGDLCQNEKNCLRSRCTTLMRFQGLLEWPLPILLRAYRKHLTRRVLERVQPDAN